MSHSAPSSSDFLFGLDPRERLEFEVSQLVDGTLDPSRRPFVEAALAQDAELAALRDELAAVDAMLTRDPSPAELRAASKSIVSNVMAVVHAESADADVVVAVPGTRSPSFWRTWGVTTAAAAAALAVGVGIGIYNGTKPSAPANGGGGQVAQNDPTDGGEGVEPDAPSVLTITGPAIAGLVGEANVDGPDRPGRTATLSVNTVRGPHIANAYAPEDGLASGGVETPFPDYAAIYNAGVVVEVPGKVSIVSADFTE